MRFWRHVKVGSATLLVVALLVLEGCVDEVEVGNRNVIFIVVDTLRADALSISGGGVRTPNLDHLARLGARFERSYSHVPVTGPSHASMFTGLLPSEHGVVVNADPLPDKLTTLAEILRDRSYSTAAIVSLGVLQGKYGFDQGFDEFDERFGENYFRSGDEITEAALEWLAAAPRSPFFLWLHYSDPHEPYSPPTESFPLAEVWLNSRYLQTISADGYRQIIELDLESGDNTLLFASPRGEIEPQGELQFRQMRLWSESVSMVSPDGWLEDTASTNKKRIVRLEGLSALPTALTLTNPSPLPQRVRLTFLLHEPYTPERARELYGAETVFLDHQIGNLLASLERLHLLEDSILVLTSDHGEGLGEHDLVGHIQQVYDSLLRVPLLMAAPGLIPNDITVNTTVRHIDVLPTLLHWLQIEIPSGLSGVSLAPLMSGQRPGTPLPVHSGTYRPLAKFDQQSLVRFPYKYILNLQTSKEELYHLELDPGEVNDLMHQSPEIAAKLRLEMESRAHSASPDETKDATELSQEELDKLRALGYIN